ncbi:VOC family protein [Brucella sp. HL-2]|nr:VOC family protein [Brucella sp. HL-2]MCV9907932.1 VOC family protein [Brucella sp. HL-2]
MTFHLPIDHVVVLTNDLDSTGTAFENVGFHVTPIAKHSAAMGTANRCVMLNDTYIEILAIIEKTEANAKWRKLLENGSGLRGIALRSKDVEADARAYNDKNIETEAVRHFSRQIEAGELRFSISRFKDCVTPAYQCLLCQHHTPELLWTSDLIEHPNGARRLISIATPNASELEVLSSNCVADITISIGRDRLTISGNSEAIFDLRESCGLEITMVRT